MARGWWVTKGDTVQIIKQTIVRSVHFDPSEIRILLNAIDYYKRRVISMTDPDYSVLASWVNTLRDYLPEEM